MTIETAIQLDEDQHAFLVSQVEDGTYAGQDWTRIVRERETP